MKSGHFAYEWSAKIIISRSMVGLRSGSAQLEDVVIEDTDRTASLNEFLSDVDDVTPSDDRSHDTDEEEVPSDDDEPHDPGGLSHDAGEEAKSDLTS